MPFGGDSSVARWEINLFSASLRWCKTNGLIESVRCLDSLTEISYFAAVPAAAAMSGVGQAFLVATEGNRWNVNLITIAGTKFGSKSRRRKSKKQYNCYTWQDLMKFCHHQERKA